MKYSWFIFVFLLPLFFDGLRGSSTPLSFSFSGSLQSGVSGVNHWNGLILSPPQCDLYTTDTSASYLALNLYFDASNASVYFILGHAYNDSYSIFSGFFNVFVYEAFDPNNPCGGLYDKGQLLQSLDQGPYVNDAINFLPGSYTVVTSILGDATENQALFILKFTQSTFVFDILASNPQWYPSYYYGPGSSLPNNCTYESVLYVYGTNQWIQEGSGYFDIEVAFLNSSIVNINTIDSPGLYIAVYNGSLPYDVLTSNPCSTNFLFGSYNYYSTLGGIDKIWLNDGVNYSIIVSTYYGSYFGKVGVSVTPTILSFLQNSPAFVPPNQVSSCSASTHQTAWFSFNFFSTSNFYIFDTSAALFEDYLPGRVTYSYLYSGNNTGSPPSTCGYELLNQASTGQNPLGLITEDQNSFTVVVIDSSFETNLDYYDSAFRFYFLYGDTYLNESPFLFVPYTPTTTATTGNLILTTTASSLTSTTGIDLETTTSAGNEFFATTTSSDSTSGTSESLSTTTTGGQLTTTSSSTSTGDVEGITTSGSTSSTGNDQSFSTTTSSGSLSSTTTETQFATTSDSVSTTTSSSSTTVSSTTTTDSDISSSSSSISTGDVGGITTTVTISGPTTTSTTTTSGSGVVVSSTTSATTTTGPHPIPLTSSTTTSGFPSSLSQGSSGLTSLGIALIVIGVIVVIVIVGSVLSYFFHKRSDTYVRKKSIIIPLQSSNKYDQLPE